MISLNEFLVKGKIDNSYHWNRISTYTIPNLIKVSDGVYKYDGNKKIKMPDYKFVLYNDKYRGNRPHIASIQDMLWNYGWFYDDYEDFSIKDILFAADDIATVAKWFIANVAYDGDVLNEIEDKITECNNSNDPYAKDDLAEDICEILDDAKQRTSFCDNTIWLSQILAGNDDGSDQFYDNIPKDHDISKQLLDLEQNSLTIV